MPRALLALVASAVLGSVGAWLILDNAYPHEGPWVSISSSHGIHVGDVGIVLLWAGATAGLVHWARAPRHRTRTR